MNPLWLIPSLIMGAVYAFGSGNWMMLVATVMTLLIGVLVGKRGRVLEGDLKITNRGIWLGAYRLPRWSLFWGSKLNAAVAAALPSPIDDARLKRLRDKNWNPGVYSGFLIGVDSQINLQNGVGHLLVIGPTGAGKSELIHLVLASVGSGIEVNIADYKGGAVLTEAKVSAGISDLESIQGQADFWTGLSEELTRREAALRSLGVSSIEHAERLGLGFRRRLVIVDELVAAIRAVPQANAALISIATRGRSLGMHLLVTSQSLTGIPREILVNLRSRLALAGTDEVELLQLGFKQNFSPAPAKTKAALLSQDGQVSNVVVPLGVRRAPQPVA